MNIFYKIQLTVIIVAISAISILVYIDQAYATPSDCKSGPSPGKGWIFNEELCDWIITSEPVFRNGVDIETQPLSIDEQMNNDSCPVIHFLNYAWEDCGSIFTWSIFGIPVLVIIVTSIGSISAFIIWRKRK